MDPPKFHPQGVRLDRAARGAPYVPLSERLAKPALLPAPRGGGQEVVGATASLRADAGERKQRVAAMEPPSGEKALGSHLRAPPPPDQTAEILELRKQLSDSHAQLSHRDLELQALGQRAAQEREILERRNRALKESEHRLQSQLDTHEGLIDSARSPRASPVSTISPLPASRLSSVSSESVNNDPHVVAEMRQRLARAVGDCVRLEKQLADAEAREASAISKLEVAEAAMGELQEAKYEMERMRKTIVENAEAYAERDQMASDLAAAQEEIGQLKSKILAERRLKLSAEDRTHVTLEHVKSLQDQGCARMARNRNCKVVLEWRLAAQSAVIERREGEHVRALDMCVDRARISKVEMLARIVGRRRVHSVERCGFQRWTLATLRERTDAANRAAHTAAVAAEAAAQQSAAELHKVQQATLSAKQEFARKLKRLEAAHEAEAHSAALRASDELDAVQQQCALLQSERDTATGAHLEFEVATKNRLAEAEEAERHVKIADQTSNELSIANAALSRSNAELSKFQESAMAHGGLAVQLAHATAERDSLQKELQDLAKRRGSELGDQLAASESLAAEKKALLERLYTIEREKMSSDAALSSTTQALGQSKATAERYRQNALRRCHRAIATRLGGVALATWRENVKLLAERQDQYLDVLARILHYKTGRSFDKWVQWISERYQLRFASVECLERLQRNRIVKVVHRWHSQAQHQRLARTHVNCANLQRVWQVWMAFIIAKQQQHDRMIRYVGAMRHKYQLRPFNAWFLHAAYCERLRKLALAALERMIVRKVSRAFMIWCNHTHVRRKNYSTTRLALNHWYADKLTRGFEGWQHGVRTTRRGRLITSRIQARWCRETHRKFFVVWHRYTVEMSSIRAADGAIEQYAARHAAIQAQQMDAEAERMAAMDSVMEKCIAKLLRGLQDRTFTRWVNLTMKRRHARKVVKATMKRWANQRSLAPAVFTNWKAFVTQQKLMRQQQELEQMHQNMLNLQEQLRTASATVQTTVRTRSAQASTQSPLAGPTQPQLSAEDQQKLEDALAAKSSLELQVAEAQEKINELERDLAWSGDTTMALSIAHERDNQRVAEMIREKEHLELELSALKAHTDALEQDLATAGVLAAEMMCAAQPVPTAVSSDDSELAARLAAMQTDFNDKDKKLKELQAELDSALADSQQARAAHMAEITAMHEEISLLLQTHKQAHEKLLQQIGQLEEASQRDLEALSEADVKLQQEREARQAAEKRLEDAADQREGEIAALRQQHTEVVAEVQRVLLELDDDMAKLLGEDFDATAEQLLRQIESTGSLLHGDRDAVMQLLEDRSAYMSQQLREVKERHRLELVEAEEAAGRGEPWPTATVAEVVARHDAELSAVRAQHNRWAEEKAAQTKLMQTERSNIAERLTETQKLRQMVLDRLGALELQQAAEVSLLQEKQVEMLKSQLESSMNQQAMEVRLIEVADEQSRGADHGEVNSQLEHLQTVYTAQVAAARLAHDEVAAARGELSEALEEMQVRHAGERQAADELHKRLQLAEAQAAEERVAREKLERQMACAASERAVQSETLDSTLAKIRALEAEVRVAHNATDRVKRDMARRLVEIGAEHETAMMEATHRAACEVDQARQEAGLAEHRLEVAERKQSETEVAYINLQMLTDQQLREGVTIVTEMEARLVEASRSKRDLEVSSARPIMPMAD